MKCDIAFTLINIKGIHWTLMVCKYTYKTCKLKFTYTQYMDLKKKCLWHLDPLTGTPMDKTVNDFKHVLIHGALQCLNITCTVQNANQLYYFSIYLERLKPKN